MRKITDPTLFHWQAPHLYTSRSPGPMGARNSVLFLARTLPRTLSGNWGRAITWMQIRKDSAIGNMIGTWATGRTGLGQVRSGQVRFQQEDIRQQEISRIESCPTSSSGSVLCPTRDLNRDRRRREKGRAAFISTTAPGFLTVFLPLVIAQTRIWK